RCSGCSPGLVEVARQTRDMWMFPTIRSKETTNAFSALDARSFTDAMQVLTQWMPLSRKANVGVHRLPGRMIRSDTQDPGASGAAGLGDAGKRAFRRSSAASVAAAAACWFASVTAA